MAYSLQQWQVVAVGHGVVLALASVSIVSFRVHFGAGTFQGADDGTSTPSTAVSRLRELAQLLPVAYSYCLAIISCYEPLQLASLALYRHPYDFAVSCNNKVPSRG